MKFTVNEKEYEIPEELSGPVQEYIDQIKSETAENASRGAIQSNERQWAARVANLLQDDSIRGLKAKEVTERLNEAFNSKPEPKSSDDDIKKQRGQLEAELQAERRKMREQMLKEQMAEKIHAKLVTMGLNEDLQSDSDAMNQIINKIVKIESDGENVFFRDAQKDVDIFDPKTNQPADWQYVANQVYEKKKGLFTTPKSGGGSAPTSPTVNDTGKNWLDIPTAELLNS